jgi:hypothetical protein
MTRYRANVIPQDEAVQDMFVNDFCDLHKQQIAANDIALPNVMNHVIASTANRYLWSPEGLTCYEIKRDPFNLQESPVKN